MKKIFTFLVLSVILTGCSDSFDGYGNSKTQISRHLPPNAQNVSFLGNGWCTFELNGQKFLFHQAPNRESLTILP